MASQVSGIWNRKTRREAIATQKTLAVDLGRSSHQCSIQKVDGLDYSWSQLCVFLLFSLLTSFLAHYSVFLSASLTSYSWLLLSCDFYPRITFPVYLVSSWPGLLCWYLSALPRTVTPWWALSSLFKVLELESDCLSSSLLGQKFCLSAYGLFCRSSHTELHRLWIGCYAYPSCEELWVVCACVHVWAGGGAGRGKRWRQDTGQNSSWFKATAASVAMMGKAVAATAADVLNLGSAWSLCVLIKQQVICVSPSMFLALF